MAQIDLEERSIKLEHIEGYLYGLQEIDNHIVYSQGSTNSYSIFKSDENKLLSNSESIVNLIFNKVSHYPDFTDQVKLVFNENIITKQIPDWRHEMKENLNKWLIDKHLSERNIRVASIKYMNQFEDWTEEQKDNYISNFEESERRASLRLNDSKKSIEILIDLIQVFMKSDFNCFKYDFSEVKENSTHYPSKMNYHWGWEFDIYQLKNETENVALHFGKLLN